MDGGGPNEVPSIAEDILAIDGDKRRDSPFSSHLLKVTREVSDMYFSFH